MNQNIEIIAEQVSCICSICKKATVKLKEVYYKENEQLRKPQNNIFIGWCKSCKTYILK